jgi:hypothetical protein
MESIHKECHMRQTTKNDEVRLKLCAMLGTAVSIALLASCGPKCPEVKSSLGEDDVTKEDISRVNLLVAKRKEAMADAAAGENATVPISKLQFSVTAYELAIEAELRVIQISPKFEGSELWAKNRVLFDDMRCYFDGLVAADTPHVISDPVGRDIQQWSQKVAEILKTQGTVSDYDLREYLEKGMSEGSTDEEE